SDRRDRDAGRPLLDDHPGDGDRRIAGGEEIGAPVGGYVPDHRWPVHRPSRRRDPHHRWIDVLPRAGPPPDRRTPPHGPRHHFRGIELNSGATSMSLQTTTTARRAPVSALFDPKIVLPAIGAAFVKLDPRTLVKNPVMFVLEVVTVLTTILFVRDLLTGGE